MDTERASLLGRIEDALETVGWLQARSLISPFDKLTGGLAWCIAACNAGVGYDLDSSDDFILGEKIEIAESIQFALRRMGCPYPLQAHQIQGLDYPAVLPVVQWLVKQVLDERAVQYQAEELEDPEQPTVQRDHSDIVICYDKQIEAIRNEIKVHQERLAFLKRRKEAETKINRRDFLQAAMAKSNYAGDSELLTKVVNTLKSLKSVDQERAESMEDPKRTQEDLLKEVKHLKERLSVSEVKGGEYDMEKKTSLRKELARISRDVVVLQRRLDEVPSQSELVQYERCFMELYLNIQSKLRETRKYFASYNALAEAHKLSLKEISLLNSINSQYEVAISTPEGRAKFVESMQGLLVGVQQNLKKMEARLLEKKTMFNHLKEKHASALATRRNYYALLKQLQEEFVRNEKLLQNAP